MEKTQTRSESQTQLVEQIKRCLRSGDYSRVLDLLRGAGAEFPNDVELSELEKLARDGVKRNAEASRLITESQELFAQRKAAEAIQLLRQAYELDKNNSLARAILANALVEHAQSVVETDWLKAETLTNQALALNPAHPTAKTILSRIVEQKEKSSVEDWVLQASKHQSSGDLFAALAWVAEGLAVHPNDPKLLQIQDAIQRDQSARRRQARRGDLEDLRRLQREINGAADVAAKQALAARIQALAAKHWTDGEILSIANALLLRLGLVTKESSGPSPRSKGAAVILHVPYPSAPKPSSATSEIPASQAQPRELPQSAVLPIEASPTPVPPEKVASVKIPPRKVVRGEVPNSRVPLRTPPRSKVRIAPPELELSSAEAAAVAVIQASAAPAKVATPSSHPKQSPRSAATTLILISSTVAAMILILATFLFTRRHSVAPVAKTATAAPIVSTPKVSAPVEPAAVISAPAQTTAELSVPAAQPSSDSEAAKLSAEDQPPPQPGRMMGTLLIVAGQDDAKVFLNGKLQPQLTRAGQLRLANLELKTYVVRVSKSGFEDPPQQQIRIREGEEAKLVFNLQPQPRLAALNIQGGAPGTTVLVDQGVLGSIHPDGTLSISSVNPGDHTIELRKDRFKPRQLKKHFIAGGTITLVAADTTLEAVPSELKITFTPADASVAIVKGDLLKMVSSGVPLNLPAGTYTLTARTSDRFTRSSTLEITAGQSRTLDLSLAPSGMANWDDPGAWKHEKDSYVRKGGDFVLYGVIPTTGTLVFSAMPAKGRLLQWVLNYTDAKNYLLFQMDENYFYRVVIRNGERTNEIKVPHKSDKKSLHMLQIRIGASEIVHQVKQGNSWVVLDRWAPSGSNLSSGKFGFYIPGNDEVALSSFAHYADLNIR